ncbi:Gag-pol fusion polyprotein [Elysia marginata]|uniref:Gag-pol fusion polyprotein n=1 Tax=Elysia marginata TaxID=1093978 RepID=A0AAV4GC64_9GAST|nr:Gag-pol fusion polyprotein [Elysia marginata]
MHREDMRVPVQPTPQDHGGEGEVQTTCTSFCTNGSQSCGKVMLVRVRAGSLKDSVLVYAILDDQSNRTLASTALLDKLGVTTKERPYKLSSCAGTVMASGRTAEGLYVQSFDRKTTLGLPSVLECSLPEDISEIPTPEVARNYLHLQSIASHLPPYHSNANIGLLIGRDVPQAHHVLDQIVGKPSAPFAQQLSLGWAVIGEVCLDGKHRPLGVRVNKTYVTSGGRGTIFEPCFNKYTIQERENLGVDVFARTKDDEKQGMSVEDKKFISLMEASFKKVDGHWSAPLPFKDSKSSPPSNFVQALRRAHLLQRSMDKNPQKKDHMVKFMAKLFETGAAERAPPIEEGRSRWYLPLFGVYHPRKPDKIRGVFDSSAIFQGFSLNSMLLSCPDLTNSLIGILIRFCRDSCPITADIEQMFYQFNVDEQHRDFLRFLWFEDNNPEKGLVEYRMTVHGFGNSPSPAVATYGLRKTVTGCEQDIIDSERFLR